MNIENIINTLYQVRMFLNSTIDVGFAIDERVQVYQFIEQSLKRFDYLKCSKMDKGVLLKYLQKVSGCSRILVKLNINITENIS